MKRSRQGKKSQTKSQTTKSRTKRVNSRRSGQASRTHSTWGFAWTSERHARPSAGRATTRAAADAGRPTRIIATSVAPEAYGLSLQDYRAMLERQGNICGICKTPGKPLCVDHCHATGKVRGLLCRDCNLGLGNYKDNPVFTRAATAYLEAARRDDGNQRSAAGEDFIRFHDLRVRHAPAWNAGVPSRSRLRKCPCLRMRRRSALWARDRGVLAASDGTPSGSSLPRAARRATDRRRPW